MEYGEEMEEMDPVAQEAKVSALKDLVSMMQGMIAEAGGDPDEEVVPDEMPMAAEGGEGVSAIEDVMSQSEKETGMGHELKEYMNGNKLKPKGKALTVAVSVSKNKPKDMGMSKPKGKSKKSKMKRYG